MNNRNPYLSSVIVWIGAILINLVACICGVINGILWQALFNLAIIMFGCICLGWTICKFNAYREFLKNKKMIERALKDFEELMKVKENEPFKEFENEKS